MEQAQINLSKLDIKELKSMAYDQIAMKEVIENNLRQINQEILKKQQEVPVEDKVEEKTE